MIGQLFFYLQLQIPILIVKGWKSQRACSVFAHSHVEKKQNKRTQLAVFVWEDGAVLLFFCRRHALTHPPALSHCGLTLTRATKVIQNEPQTQTLGSVSIVASSQCHDCTALAPQLYCQSVHWGDVREPRASQLKRCCVLRMNLHSFSVFFHPSCADIGLIFKVNICLLWKMLYWEALMLLV